MNIRYNYITSFNILRHELLLLAFMFRNNEHKEEYERHHIKHHNGIKRGYEPEDAHRGRHRRPCVYGLDEDERKDAPHEERELRHLPRPELPLPYDHGRDQQYWERLDEARPDEQVHGPGVHVEVRLAQEVHDKVHDEDEDERYLGRHGDERLGEGDLLLLPHVRGDQTFPVPHVH